MSPRERYPDDDTIVDNDEPEIIIDREIPIVTLEDTIEAIPCIDDSYERMSIPTINGSTVHIPIVIIPQRPVPPSIADVEIPYLNIEPVFSPANDESFECSVCSINFSHAFQYQNVRRPLVLRSMLKKIF